MIFCFSSENSKFEVRAGGSLPLSIIVKMSCKMFNQYSDKIPVYCDPPPTCNLTNKALAIKIFIQNAGILLENFNVGRLTAQVFQFTKHFLTFIQCTRYCITGAILKN